MNDLWAASRRGNEREETRSHPQHLVCRLGLELRLNDQLIIISTVRKNPHIRTKEETDEDALGKLRSSATCRSGAYWVHQKERIRKTTSQSEVEVYRRYKIPMLELLGRKTKSKRSYVYLSVRSEFSIRGEYTDAN